MLIRMLQVLAQCCHLLALVLIGMMRRTRQNLSADEGLQHVTTLSLFMSSPVTVYV